MGIDMEEALSLLVLIFKVLKGVIYTTGEEKKSFIVSSCEPWELQ